MFDHKFVLHLQSITVVTDIVDFVVQAYCEKLSNLVGLSIVFNKFYYALCFYHISHTIMIHTNKYNCNSLVFYVLCIVYII